MTHDEKTEPAKEPSQPRYYRLQAGPDGPIDKTFPEAALRTEIHDCFCSCGEPETCTNEYLAYFDDSYPEQWQKEGGGRWDLEDGFVKFERVAAPLPQPPVEQELPPDRFAEMETDVYVATIEELRSQLSAANKLVPLDYESATAEEASTAELWAKGYVGANSRWLQMSPDNRSFMVDALSTMKAVTYAYHRQLRTTLSQLSAANKLVRELRLRVAELEGK